MSVFGGAADRKNFVLKNQGRTKRVHSHKTNLTSDNASLNALYQRVRDFRDQGATQTQPLEAVILDLNEHHQKDWLLRLELLEIFDKLNKSSVFTAQLRKRLKELQSELPAALGEMINRGVEIA